MFVTRRKRDLQENAWQLMRDNYVSNHAFQSHEAIAGHCCEAWNELVERPWLIMSSGLRGWARRP